MQDEIMSRLNLARRMACIERTGNVHKILVGKPGDTIWDIYAEIGE
jgi:hypothetical protein